MSKIDAMMAVVKSLKNGEVTRQVMKGKTVTRYNGTKEVRPNWFPEVEITRVSAETDGVQRTVTRQIVNEKGITEVGDNLKIKTTENYPVGDKRVNTQTIKNYKYFGKELITTKKQHNRVFKGDEFIGSRETFIENNHYDGSIKEKIFRDKNGERIKTVGYNPSTGIREYTKLPDGKMLLYDEKGLPAWTNAIYSNRLDLGGLDKLV